MRSSPVRAPGSVTRTDAWPMNPLLLGMSVSILSCTDVTLALGILLT